MKIILRKPKDKGRQGFFFSSFLLCCSNKLIQIIFSGFFYLWASPSLPQLLLVLLRSGLLPGDGGLVRVIAAKIVQNGGEARVVREDLQNLLALLKGNLLGVSAVCHWLSLIILQLNMTEQGVGQVLHNQPLDLVSQKKSKMFGKK